MGVQLGFMGIQLGGKVIWAVYRAAAAIRELPCSGGAQRAGISPAKGGGAGAPAD